MLHASAAALESARGRGACALTRNFLIERVSACADGEDVVSMALAATCRLLRQCGVAVGAIGQLQVGCSSPLDRSKSIKSELMALVEGCDSADSEGVDCCGASDAMAAVLSCVHWVQSASWDGRWAVAVCSEAGAPLQLGAGGGAAAVAVLVGPNGVPVQDPPCTRLMGLPRIALPREQSMVPMVEGHAYAARLGVRIGCMHGAFAGVLRLASRLLSASTLARFDARPLQQPCTFWAVSRAGGARSYRLDELTSVAYLPAVLLPSLTSWGS